MSLLDFEDADTPLNPSPSPAGLRDDLGHVSSNPAAVFLEDPSTVVLANSYSSGDTSNTVSGYATVPRVTSVGGGGASGPDVTSESAGATPVKHSKLTKFIAHRKKLSKGSIKVKKGGSPPPSPKALKAASSSPEQAKKKHRYSTLRDDSASDSSLGHDSPDNLDPSTGATIVPGFAEVSTTTTTPVRGSTSSPGDVGSELLSPVGSSAGIGSPVASTTGVQGGLVRPARQGQPSVAISSAVAGGHSQVQAPVMSMVSPWVSSSPQAAGKTDTVLMPTPSSQPVPQVAANSPWTNQSSAAAGKESTAAASITGQPASDSDWIISDEMRQKLVAQFWELSPENGLLKGEKARSFFVKSKLPNHELSHIWKLSDINEDNSLSEDEFCIAMKLVVARRKGLIIPSALPEVLRPQPQSASGQKGSEQTGQKSPPATGDWARFPTPTPGSPPSSSVVDGLAGDEPSVALPPPPSHGKRAARTGKQEGTAGMPPSKSFEDMLQNVAGPSDAAEGKETSTAGTHPGMKLSGEHTSSTSDNWKDLDQVIVDESSGPRVKPPAAATLLTESAMQSMSMAATGQLVQLDEDVTTTDSPPSKEASPVLPNSEEEEEEEEDERSALYTAVNKAWKTPKKKSPKLIQVDSPSPTAEESSDGRASASSGAEMEQLDSAVVGGRSSQPKATPPLVKPKPRRPPPPRPIPFAEHKKKLSSPPHVGKDEMSPPTGSLVELEQDMGIYEVVDSKDGQGLARAPPGKATASHKHSSRTKPPISTKPAGRGNEKVGGVKVHGLEKKDVVGGVGADEIKSALAGLKARGHQRTSSLDSKKEELAASQEYQSLIEGLPPANPPAPPPKPIKRGNFLEEPPRQAGGSAGRKISRSASMDSISSLSSLSSHPGTAASPAPLQKPEGRLSPQTSPKAKKKPLPLPSTKLPIHPSRKPTLHSDVPKTSSKPSSTSAETSSASHAHTQPVAPGNRQFGRVLKELHSLKSSSAPSGSDSAHPTAPAPHGADVLSVAIAIAEKASVLPSSSQHKSVLRDKAVVQGAIKTLQEEVGALKSTNMELQNQLCLLVEERNRLRAKARAAVAKR